MTPQYVQDRLNLYDAVLFLQGLGNTVTLCLVGLCLGTLIALLVGLARASHSRWLAWPAGLYIEVIRDSPLLMQLYLIFFALPLLGLNVPVFAAGVATLMVNGSAFMAEIVRAGVQSVGKDQWDAARGLGMGYLQVMRWVVIPQAFRVMIPPGVGLLIGLIKDSSLISVIAVSDLTYVAKNIVTTTFRAFEVWLAIAVFYFVLSFALSWSVRSLEHRLAQSD